MFENSELNLSQKLLASQVLIAFNIKIKDST